MDLLRQFQKIFHTSENPRAFFAPGRVNLIGEHVDYNGGHVLPAAISYGTFALAVKRKDQKIRLYSANMSEMGMIECHLDHLDYHEKHSWGNYPKGMIYYFKKEMSTINFGLDILYYGNIPSGAGLSSSASLEMVTGVLLNNIFHLNIDHLFLIKTAQKVENDYMNVNTGIMDPFAIGMGKKDRAILLNTNTLNYKYAPLPFKNHTILIMNTNKKRSLVDSKYNERYSECQKALKQLQTKIDIDFLCQLTIEQFNEYKHLISNQTLQKRAKHVISENSRTLQAFDFLKEYDLYSFGQLMTESHKSLQKDYEVTGKELDAIVYASLEQEGVLGARMTGGGFGGCAIALVENNYIHKTIDSIQEIYMKTIGKEATFYKALIVDGPREISIEQIHKK